MAEGMSLNERADALERKMSDELDVLISKSALFNMADGKLGAVNMPSKGGKYQLMDDDPRLPKMPAKPTLLDLSLIHISEPTRQAEISYAVFCLKKKKKR